MRGAEVRVQVLDDGNDDAMRELAARHGVGYITPRRAHGRQGGQHQPRADEDRRAVHRRVRLGPRGGPRLPRGHARAGMEDPRSRSSRRRSTTPTPSTTASPRPRGPSRRCSSAPSAAARTGSTPSSAAAPTCCSAATAFESVGGFPTNSLTEDFELSIHLHEKGWKSAYMPDVLVARPRARGHRRLRLPAAALGQGLPVRASRARCARELPLRLKAQYLLSGVVLPVRVDGAHLHELPGRFACSAGASRSAASTLPSSCSTSCPTTPSR